MYPNIKGKTKAKESKKSGSEKYPKKHSRSNRAKLKKGKIESLARTKRQAERQGKRKPEALDKAEKRHCKGGLSTPRHADMLVIDNAAYC